MSIKLDCGNTISFERPLTRLNKQHIRIENPNEKPIAFKVKTTAPKFYCVRPNCEIIQPGESVDVQLMLQAVKEEPALDVKCKDKFLILSTVIQGPLVSMPLQDLWTYVETKAKDSIHEHKLRCVFTQAVENTSTLNVPVTTPVTTAPVAKAAASTVDTETPAKDKEIAEKMKLMEQQLQKYKKEVESLRESETVAIEKVKPTGYPIGIIILFALLAVAVAYFLRNND